MSRIVDPQLEAYATAHSDPHVELLAELEKETYATMQHATMQVGPLEGAFLRMLVRVSGARRILEVGTFTGYSALSMAQGLPEDGLLLTCDLDPKALEVARRYFARSPHGPKIRVEEGPALATLARLEGPFDLVFLDADKENYLAYYERALALLRPGGLLVADNTLWSGRVLAPASEADQAIVRFNDAVAKDPRVERVLLTLRDGVTVARKL